MLFLLKGIAFGADGWALTPDRVTAGHPCQLWAADHLRPDPDQAAQWAEARNPPWWRGALRPWDAEPTPLQLALARGHRWLALLASGEVKSLREIARKDGVDSSYVSRMVNLTTVAPEHRRSHPR